MRIYRLLSILAALGILLLPAFGPGVLPIRASGESDAQSAGMNTPPVRRGSPSVSDTQLEVTSTSVEFLGHIGGTTEVVFVNGDYAYIGEGPRLTILDVSDPAAPTVIGKTTPLPGLVEDIYVAEIDPLGRIYAYIAGHSAGLRVVDVSDPASPVEVGFYDTPGIATGVAVVGSLVYVSDYEDGLRVVDVSDPADPTGLGFLDTPSYAFDVAVADDTAYVADGDGGLRVVDVSNPMAPVELGSCDALTYPVDIALTGSMAYVADYYGSGLGVVDVSDPAVPVKIGFSPTPGGIAEGVAVADSLAYIVTGYGGLRVLDVSDPAAPVEAGFYDTPGIANGVAVAGGLVYVADYDGLQVVDVSDPALPVGVGFYDRPGAAHDVALAEGTVYVSDQWDGMWMVDASDPAVPLDIGFHHTPTHGQDVVVTGTLAYVADGPSGLRVVDVSDPATPVEVGFHDTPWHANGVAVAGDIAYIADGYSGLRVVDVSDPAAPAEVGFCDTPGYAESLAVEGGVAYVADRDGGLRVIDVSDPATPVEIGACDTSYANHVAIADGHAYVADGDSGLRVIDVRDPAAPMEVGSHDVTGSAVSVVVVESTAYVTGGWIGGLRVVDVSDPAAPVETGFYDTPGSAEEAVVSKNRVYVADGSGGLILLQATHDGLVASYPFDGNADDVSGYGNHGAVHGAALTEDRFGTPNAAYAFDGVDDYIQVPDDDSLDLGTAFTLVAWVKSNDTSGPRGIIAKWNDDTWDHAYYLKSHNHSDHFRIELSKGDHNDLADLEGATSILTDTWIHVAATYQAPTVTLYYNGAADASLVLTETTSITRTETDLLIGALFNYGISENFDGVIDDVAIYNRALSPAEIQDLMGSRTCWARINDETADYASVQAAVDAAQPGDRVKVAGTCQNDGALYTVQITKSLTLQGGYTTTNWTTPDPVAHRTVLDGSGTAFSDVSIEHTAYVTVTGFWLTGAERMICIHPGSHVLIERNWIHDAAGDNYTSGINVESTADFTTTDVTIRNNFIWNITGSGDRGGGIDVGSHQPYATQNIDVLHNTIYNVSQYGILMGVWHPVYNARVENNIVVKAADTGIQFSDISVGVSDYNNVYDTPEFYYGVATPFTGGEHDVHLDPQFVDAASGELHLQSSSPVRDVGTATAVVEDIDGDPRPMGSGPDLGADEYAVALQVRAFLAGPMEYYPDHHPDPDTMPTGLQGLGAAIGQIIPHTSPYCEDPREVEAIPTPTVDWVLVELRSAPDGPAVASRSAFLRNDGYVVGDDGLDTSLPFDVPPGAYYVVVKHRNHLPVMSANPVNLTPGGVATYDFTIGSQQTYGGTSGTTYLSNGMWGMIGGDVDGDGSIDPQDYQACLDNIGDIGYENADITLCGLPEGIAASMVRHNEGRHTTVPNGGLSACPVHLIAVLAFDNDLDVHIEDVIERLGVGTGGSSNAVATLLVDGEDEGGDTYVYEVAAGVISSTVVPTFTGELNTADPDVLADFIVWARGQHPGHRDAVALVGHGVGPAPEIHAPLRQIGVRSTLPPLPVGRDFTPADVTSGAYLSTPELGRALAAATDSGADPLELLLLDSCFEGNLDVLYEVRNAAEVLVASPNYAWAAFAYDRYLPHFTPGATPGEMAQAVVEEYQSALDNTHPNAIFWLRGDDVDAIAGAVNALGDALQATLDSGNEQLILEATLHSQFADTTLCHGDLALCPPDELVDLRSFATNLRTRFGGVDPAVHDATGDVLTELAGVHATYRSGAPWVREDRTWTFTDPAPTIVAPLTRTLEADPVWLASIYTETVPLVAVWSPVPTDTVTVTTPLAFTTEGRWDDFIAAWYGPLTPTVGPLCHAFPPPRVITGSETIDLTAQPGLVGAHLSWTSAAHPDAVDYAVYIQRPDAATWELLQIVPLSQTTYDHAEAVLPSGEYTYSVAARNVQGELVATSNEVAVDVGVTAVAPDRGYNDVATLVYVHGTGLEMPATVAVGGTQLDIVHSDAHLIVVWVPAGLPAGTYDLSVTTPAGQAIVYNAYRSMDRSMWDDLRADPAWIWTNPSPLRVGYTGSGIGLNVEHHGGKSTLEGTAVEFRLGAPQGTLLGQTSVPLLPPGALSPTMQLEWEPATAGRYTLCAIIDPDDEVDESDETNNTVCRTVTVLSPMPDMAPPVVNSFVIEDDALTTPDLDVTLDVTATDHPIPGASGVQAIKFIEFEYGLGAGSWVPLTCTDWIAYPTAHRDYPWSLQPVFGVRYMQAWAVDNAGNVSPAPRGDAISLLPTEQDGFVAQNGVVVYRIHLAQDEIFSAQLVAVSGDPDLYVWGPSGQLWYSHAPGDDQVSLTAPVAGTYQVEVHGYTDAHYRLTFGSSRAPVEQVGSTNDKALPSGPAVPLGEQPPLYYPDSPGPSEYRIYLPTVARSMTTEQSRRAK